jgi:EmrB/QacA subfamily drug resistance transporter
MARKWWTLIAVCVATFMLILDVTVVNVALPSIRKDLGASFTDLQWVVDAYALTLAAFVLTSGSLADQLGRRRVFVVGLAIFTVASALCALSTSPTMLNVSRAVQGVGAAIMFAVSLALLGQEFRGRDRANATAIYGASIGVAVAAGPLFGGALTDGLGWESIFWINVPIGIAAIFITITKLAESRDPHARGIDWPGLFTFSVANTLLVFGLIRGNPDGWQSTTVLGSLIVAGVLFVAFVFAETRVDQPMLPLGFFRNRSFTGAQIAAFSISASMFALFLYLTLYVQNLLDYTAFQAGLIYLPSTIVTFVFSGLTAAFMARIPLRIILSVGLAILAVGLLMLAGREEGDTWTSLLPGFITTGVGVGMINPVIANLALSTVPDEHGGVASGINDTFRQVGIATGVAALGALLLARAADKIESLLPAVTHDQARRLAEGVSSGALPDSLPAAVVGAARQGYIDGLNEVLLIGAGIAFAGAVLSLWLVRAADIRAEEIEADDPLPVPVAGA